MRQFDAPGPINPALLGNKGASLAEMTRLGLPIPPGFTLTTSVWPEFHQRGKLPEKIWREVLKQLAILERKTEKKFGDPNRPLIVSVRSGARHSMPGMMDTVLNIGLTLGIMSGLTTQIGQAATQDSLRRLNAAFEKITGETPAQNPFQQLRISIEAVFYSWNNPQAVIYRKYNGIPQNAGTAVNIQEMIFGNINDGQSGTGVFFTRNPVTGENKPAGEFVPAGQGEDVVLAKKQARRIPKKILLQLTKYGKKLEKYFHDPQDIEFTLEKGEIKILQSRTLKGTPLAQIQIAIDLVQEGLISQKKAYQRVKPTDKQTILRPGFEKKALEKARRKSLIGQGKPASIGAAVGTAVFTPRNVGEKPVILVCSQIDPNDIATLHQVEALLTTQGGTASHMALILQALGKAAVVCVKWQKKPKKNEIISVNGITGEVFRGRVILEKKPNLSQKMKEFIKKWQKVWGKSVWASSLYPVEKKYSRQAFLEKIEVIGPEINKWSSRKTQTTILLNHVIPEKNIIQSKVFKPDNLTGMRKALKTIAVQKGFQAIPRSCYYPEQLITPWAAIPNQAAIEDFLTNLNFPGKYGGLPKWQKISGLSSIIIPAEPEGKLDPKLALEHFAFTITCLPSRPPKVIIDLQLEEPHLRGFEKIPSKKLIQIIVNLNYSSPYYLGQIKVDFGKKWQGNPYAEKVVQIVKKKVFGEWWRPPFSLPHLMSALDEIYGLSVLEVQGRMKQKKELAWGPLVYGAKGREEKEKVSSFPR